MNKILVEKLLVQKVLVKKIKFFLQIQKMVNKYYQKYKGRLQKEARERYQNFSEGKVQERYQNFTDEEKKRRQQYQKWKKKLTDYRRNYYLAHKK